MNNELRKIRNRINRRRRVRNGALDILATLGVVAVAVTIVGGTLIGLVEGFRYLDCGNARQGLAFIEACEANPNCSLRPQELRLKEVYTRLEIRSCKED